MKSLISLWEHVATDVAAGCCTSTTRDLKTVTRRFEHEGLSFLTITLPQFGKDFEKSLDQRMVDHDLFLGFKRKGGLPRFLGGFLDHVFDRRTGVLLDDPCINCIYAVRQLTLMVSKMFYVCDESRVAKAMSDFVQCEMDVKSSDRKISKDMWLDFSRISQLLFADLFSAVDSDVYYGNLVPKHGPGATADRLRGNAKHRQSHWPSRLQEYFPREDFLIPNLRFYEDLEEVTFIEPGEELPVKVTPVPKTQKTPRIIAIEPAAMQYAQQAVSGSILVHLKEINHLFKMIGFDDQTPNQKMARQGSITGDLATIDLSEASDRVSNQHVREMLKHHPHLHAAVDASRSRKADVPGFGEIRLAKYASMGSALCFPMEALIFTILVFLGIEKERKTPFTRSSIKELTDSVRVYGDDIIVPVNYVHSVVAVLEAFGFRVNRGKSFWNGSFRESCGKEYFNGFDVSIVKVRQVFPSTRRDVTEVVSLVSLRNQLYFAGCWGTCAWLDGRIKSILGRFPVVLPTSPVLGRHSFLGYQSQRTGPYLHDPQVRGWVLSSKPPIDILEGSSALLKYFLHAARFRDEDLYLPTFEGHLERSGRPKSSSIKLRWVSAV